VEDGDFDTVISATVIHGVMYIPLINAPPINKPEQIWNPFTDLYSSLVISMGFNSNVLYCG